MCAQTQCRYDAAAEPPTASWIQLADRLLPTDRRRTRGPGRTGGVRRVRGGRPAIPRRLLAARDPDPRGIRPRGRRSRVRGSGAEAATGTTPRTSAAAALDIRAEAAGQP